MQIAEWLRQYDKLRARFGYSIVEDQNAAQLLSELLEGKALTIDALAKLIRGRKVLVVGAGPSLETGIADIKLPEFTIIAADGATQALLENNIRPDIVTTDLDGSHEHLLLADKMGAIMVVHAHGDNVNLLRNLVPRMEHCIGTTQVKPLHNVHNFGGFTDGDRAVFLASELGASIIVLVGMDFGEKVGRYSKAGVKDHGLKVAKLAAGKELLEWLATFTRSRLYNASPGAIRGFSSISLKDAGHLPD